MPKYHPNTNISGQIDRFSVISRQMCLIPRAILPGSRANVPNTNKLYARGNMRILSRVLTFLALCISCAWLYFDRSFEPALTTVVSLSALISTFYFKEASENISSQSQNLGDKSQGIQASGDINISIGTSNDKEQE